MPGLLSSMLLHGWLCVYIENYASFAQVFADKRYQRHDKRDKLPGWITSHLKDAHLNLSTDMLMHIAREFMRSMAQPYDGLAIGKSLLTEAQANALSPQPGM